ncbi:hypothetical protein EV175_005641 [Coemansia sp. RSA 1933]|nr:hypothetical protein EV175_005641 [Coemansia sp. RSA 1933]
MSLSRLPQVALRRLVPALTAVPKSLDDDQLKKILDPQQQQQQQLNTSSMGMGSLPAKSEFAGIATATQGIIAALAKSGAASTSPVLGRLLTNLSGSQGNLSSQDLALLRAASTGSSSGGSPLEPASPGTELGMIDYTPATGGGSTLDVASIDALVSALQGTAAISATPSSSNARTASRRRSSRAAKKTIAQQPQHVAALEEHNQLDAEIAATAHDEFDRDSDSDGMSPISTELSAVERRKEQNRRAQKKFRQKDKVRQKEVKWRASQYEDLVASNKRFKRDIDDITRERDMYRSILERNGISLDADANKPARVLIAPASSSSSGNIVAASSNVTRTQSLASTNTANASPVLASSPLATQYHSVGGMEQIAQDTFGSFAPAMSSIHAATLPLLSLFGGSFGGGAVKADPMFGIEGMPSAVQQTSPAVVSTARAGTSSVVSLDSSLAGQVDNTGGDASAALAGNVDLDNAINALTASLQGTTPSAPPSAAPMSPSTSLWFGSSNGRVSSSDPLLIESPLMVDQHSVDTQYGGHQSTIDGQFVDPMSFIDELLSSPDYSPSMDPSSSNIPHIASGSNGFSISRKRSYDDAMF